MPTPVCRPVFHLLSAPEGAYRLYNVFVSSKAAEADGLEFVDISLGSALVLVQKDKEEVLSHFEIGIVHYYLRCFVTALGIAIK